VDVGAGVDHVEGAIMRRGSENVASLIHDSRSKHLRREPFVLVLCFAHGPPITQLLVPARAPRNLQALGALHPV